MCFGMAKAFLGMDCRGGSCIERVGLIRSVDTV